MLEPVVSFVFPTLHSYETVSASSGSATVAEQMRLPSLYTLLAGLISTSEMMGSVFSTTTESVDVAVSPFASTAVAVQVSVSPTLRSVLDTVYVSPDPIKRPLLDHS